MNLPTSTVLLLTTTLFAGTAAAIDLVDLNNDGVTTTDEVANLDDVIEEIRQTRQENRGSGSRGGNRQDGNGGRSRR